MSQNQGLDVNNVSLPVIGGHAGTTILPLLSHVCARVQSGATSLSPPLRAPSALWVPPLPYRCCSRCAQVEGANFTQEDIESLTHRIQFGGDEVVKAKDGAGSATLSMAMAGVRFTETLMRALSGESVTECAFVESDVADGCKFFSSPVKLGVSAPSAPSGRALAHDLARRRGGALTTRSCAAPRSARAWKRCCRCRPCPSTSRASTRRCCPRSPARSTRASSGPPATCRPSRSGARRLATWRLGYNRCPAAVRVPPGLNLSTRPGYPPLSSHHGRADPGLGDVQGKCHASAAWAPRRGHREGAGPLHGPCKAARGPTSVRPPRTIPDTDQTRPIN